MWAAGARRLATSGRQGLGGTAAHAIALRPVTGNIGQSPVVALRLHHPSSLPCLRGVSMELLPAEQPAQLPLTLFKCFRCHGSFRHRSDVVRVRTVAGTSRVARTTRSRPLYAESNVHSRCVRFGDVIL